MLEEIIDRIMEKHVYVKQKRSGLVSDDSIVPCPRALQKKVATMYTNYILNVQKHHGTDTAINYARSMEKNFTGFEACSKRLNQIIDKLDKNTINRIIGLLRINKGDGQGIVEAMYAAHTISIYQGSRNKILNCLEFYVERNCGDVFGEKIADKIRDFSFDSKILDPMMTKEVKKTINLYRNLNSELVAGALWNKRFKNNFHSVKNINKEAKFFRKGGVVNVFKNYNRYLEPLCYVITEISDEKIVDKTVKFYNVYSENPDKYVFRIIGRWAAKHMELLVKTSIDVFIKYKDIPEVAKTIYEHRDTTAPIHLESLLYPNVHERIKNSNDRPNVIYTLMKSHYGEYLGALRDKEVIQKISFDELSDIDLVYEMIKQIHERREHYHNKLLAGFYSELNRAISQGEDYESKVDNLKKYCKEVRNQLIERAGELMYVGS